MGYEHAVDETISELSTAGLVPDRVVGEALMLALGAWPVLAEGRPDESWDLFGLDVAAAAELLRIAVAHPPHLGGWAVDSDIVRRAVLRLVEALAEHLETPAPTTDVALVRLLEREAAAVQLRRALDAVT